MKRQLLVFILTTVITLAVIGSVQGNMTRMQAERPENSVLVPVPQQQNELTFPRPEVYWTEVKKPASRMKQGPPVDALSPIQSMPVEPKTPNQPSGGSNPQFPSKSPWGMDHGMNGEMMGH